MFNNYRPRTKSSYSVTLTFGEGPDYITIVEAFGYTEALEEGVQEYQNSAPFNGLKPLKYSLVEKIDD